MSLPSFRGLRQEERPGQPRVRHSMGLTAGLSLALLGGSPAAQAPTYPGCDTLKAGDFRKVRVRGITFGRVTMFAFTPDGRMRRRPPTRISTSASSSRA